MKKLKVYYTHEQKTLNNGVKVAPGCIVCAYRRDKADITHYVVVDMYDVHDNGKPTPGWYSTAKNGEVLPVLVNSYGEVYSAIVKWAKHVRWEQAHDCTCCKPRDRQVGAYDAYRPRFGYDTAAAVSTEYDVTQNAIIGRNRYTTEGYYARLGVQTY